MSSIIILATVMALFGVLGHQRGTKSMLSTAGLLLLGLLALSRAAGQVATLVNGMVFGVRFVFAGGLQALAAEDRNAALDAAFERVGSVARIINVNDAGLPSGPGMFLVLALLVAAAFLLGTLKILHSRQSILGLFLGLGIGYVLTAFLIRVLLPDATLQLALPAALFGAGFAVPATAALPAGPSFISQLWARALNGLNAMADQGSLALLFAAIIALFVLLATRLGNRSEKRG
ncbi:MAG: hypothetical protein BWY52_03170 [Chloroflexi bacterium ADurb.Bin325]|nr:MAG: hypothetical protein BWY52_03170 [Chloroflexi bacterium ADurb.Bin325]